MFKVLGFEGLGFRIQGLGCRGWGHAPNRNGESNNK